MLGIVGAVFVVFPAYFSYPYRFLGITFINWNYKFGSYDPSAPGYIGTFQFVCVKGLSLFNISKDIGFSFSILFHSLWYIPTTVIGIISMYLLGQNILKKNLNEIKKYE